MTRHVTRRLIIAAPAILAAAHTVAAQDMKKVSIGVTSGSIPASTARIMKELKLFEKNGLDADVKMMESGSIATMALLSGSLDLVTSGLSDAIISQARGQDVVAIVSAYRGFPGVIVVSKALAAKAGVAPTAPLADRLKALNDIVIASPSPTSIYTMTPKASAEAVGSKMKFTHMAQPAMVAAFESGAIQGYVAGAPFYSAPVLSGSGVIWIAGAEFPPQFSPAHALSLNARREFTKANPDVIQRVTAAFADFSKVVTERPADVKAALAKLYPDVPAANLDLIFATETGFRGGALTLEDIVRDIGYVKASGTGGPDIDKVDPARILYR